MDKQEKQPGSQPHVQIFGRDVTGSKNGKGCRQDQHGHRDWSCHSHSHCNVIWGMMLILAGVLFLLNNIGSVPFNVWDYIWPFWPVLLILIGFRAILGHSCISDLIVFLIALVIFGFIIVYALVHINSPLVSNLPPSWIDFVNNFKLIKQ